MQKVRPIVAYLLAAFTLVGFAAGVLAMYVAWQHNSQGEIHDETGVHWGYWLFIGLTWFAAVAGIPWLIVAATQVASRLHRP